MKKYFMIGLIMALSAPNMCPAYSYRVQQLIAEKQAKMKKLESCKGTTKNLKIAGLSTLGITVVGVGANVAEAVILNKEKGNLNTATNELELAKQRYSAAKEAQYNKYKDEALDAQKDMLDRTCNADLNPVDSYDDAKLAAADYLDKKVSSSCTLPDGLDLAGCKEPTGRSGDSVSVNCSMSFASNAGDAPKYHWFNFKYGIKTEAEIPMDEKVTGCDNAISKVKGSHSEITGSCSCNGNVVKCEKNPFVDVPFKFTEITPTGKDLKANATPSEIPEFQDKVGLYKKDVQQAKKLLAWYNKEAYANVDTSTCKLGEKNTIVCGNVTASFADVNKLAEYTTVNSLGDYFCGKFGGSWDNVPLTVFGQSKWKCTNHDNYVKSCINYVIGSSVYTGAGINSDCKTTTDVENIERDAQAKIDEEARKKASDEKLAKAAKEKSEAETKAKYCGYIYCDVSKCRFGNNTEQSSLYSVMCNDNTKTLKCYKKDSNDNQEYDCKTGKAVGTAQPGQKGLTKTATPAEKPADPAQPAAEEEVVQTKTDKEEETPKKSVGTITYKVDEVLDVAEMKDRAIAILEQRESNAWFECKDPVDHSVLCVDEDTKQPYKVVFSGSKPKAMIWQSIPVILTEDKAADLLDKVFHAKNCVYTDDSAQCDVGDDTTTYKFKKIIDTNRFANEHAANVDYAKKMVKMYAKCDQVMFLESSPSEITCISIENKKYTSWTSFKFPFMAIGEKVHPKVEADNKLFSLGDNEDEEE